MEPSNSRALSPETLARFSEGIALVLSRWTALQMAVENGWGGRESRQKSSNLADSVLSWFSQSRDTLYIDDLENLLDEEMAVSFNTEVEDGSVEEVAEQLMVMHEGCLEGNYESIEKLRNLLPLTNAVRRSKEVALTIYREGKIIGVHGDVNSSCELSVASIKRVSQCHECHEALANAWPEEGEDVFLTSFMQRLFFGLEPISSKMQEVINDDADESSDEEASDMVVDEPLMPKETAVNKPKPRQMPDEDGWSVVAPKRNRGRKPR